MICNDVFYTASVIRILFSASIISCLLSPYPFRSNKKTGLLLLFYRSYYFSYIGFIPRLVISQSAVYFVVSIHARSFHRVRLHLIDARLDFMSVGDTDFSPPATAVKLVLGVSSLHL